MPRTYRPGDRLRDRHGLSVELELLHRSSGGWRTSGPVYWISEEALDAHYEPIPPAAPVCRCEYPCSCTQEARERDKDRRIAALEASERARRDREKNLQQRIAELEAELRATQEARDLAQQECDDALAAAGEELAETQRILDQTIQERINVRNCLLDLQAELKAIDDALDEQFIPCSTDDGSDKLTRSARIGVFARRMRFGVDAQRQATNGTYRWGTEGWNLANTLTAAIERHRDAPGYITSTRDMALYRALQEADDA